MTFYYSVAAERLPGAKFCCTIPRELGAVTGMEFTKSGKLLVQTESGVPFIAPFSSRENSSEVVPCQ